MDDDRSIKHPLLVASRNSSPRREHFHRNSANPVLNGVSAMDRESKCHAQVLAQRRTLHKKSPHPLEREASTHWNIIPANRIEHKLQLQLQQLRLQQLPRLLGSALSRTCARAAAAAVAALPIIASCSRFLGTCAKCLRHDPRARPATVDNG